MATTPVQQLINNGAFLDDQSAESVYTSFEKSKVNFANLWEMVKNQGYEKILLSLTGITATSELKAVALAIQRGKFVGGSYGGSWEIEPSGRKPLFYTATPTATGGEGENTSYEYRFYRVHKAGQKFGGTNGIVIEASDISQAGTNSIGSSSSNPDAYINLGNIGTANVWTAFNVGKPAPNSGDPWLVVGLKLVTAQQNGVQKTWNFSGNQRKGIDSGLWGGSNITDPNYLAATQSDFDLLSNQPTVSDGTFITRTSKRINQVTLANLAPTSVLLSPENTTYAFEVTGGSGKLKGFTKEPEIISATYDGTDVFIKNKGDVFLTLMHNQSVDVPFKFKTNNDLILGKGDIVHLKYNASLNAIEYVGMLPITNTPVPFGDLRILKIEGNTNNTTIQAGDRVVVSNLNNDIFLSMGVYVSGNPMEIGSYDPASVDFYDPNNP